MLFPYFITKRFVTSKKETNFFSFISVITIIGIALGTGALIIALSILSGFEKTITEKVTDFDSHIKITSYRTTLPNYQDNLPRIKKIIGNNLKDINIFASSLAVITSRKGTEGINIIGVPATSTNQHSNAVNDNLPRGRVQNNNISGNKKTGLEKDIVEGVYDLNDPASVIIGKKLASKLFVKIGDRVTLFTLRNDQVPSAENFPGIQTFTIKGIFQTGMSEYDDQFVYVNLTTAQELLEIGDNINGYDIWLNNVNKADSIKAALMDSLRYPHRVNTIFEIHRNIFTWIELQQKPVPIILGLIIVVAVFNIVGTLLMMILEKTRAIGTLKAMGANSRQIISIFLLQGVVLAAIGIAAGNIIAYLLMFLQLQFDIITIPSDVYLMSSVPINMSWKVFAGVSAASFILCLLASYLPSYIASKIKPVSTLRFD